MARLAIAAIISSLCDVAEIRCPCVFDRRLAVLRSIVGSGGRMEGNRNIGQTEVCRLCPDGASRRLGAGRGAAFLSLLSTPCHDVNETAATARLLFCSVSGKHRMSWAWFS